MDLIVAAFSKIIVTMLGAILGPLTVPPTKAPRNDTEITRPGPNAPAGTRLRHSPAPQQGQRKTI